MKSFIALLHRAVFGVLIAFKQAAFCVGQTWFQGAETEEAGPMWFRSLSVGGQPEGEQ